MVLANNSVKIAIQSADFSLSDEVNLLENHNDEDGAVVTFCGRVRNNNLGKTVSGLFLEHYPGMTEKALLSIADQARERWELGNVVIVHRVGELALNENIVFVGVGSAHRDNAFLAARFIMDYLKRDAPFWKKEITGEGEQWVEQKKTDMDAAEDW